MLERQESVLFNYMLLVKIRPDMPKPWQAQHEINIEIGVTFLPNICRLRVLKLDILVPLKPLNGFYMLHISVKRRLKAFQRCIIILNPMKNNDFMTYRSRICDNLYCRG